MIVWGSFLVNNNSEIDYITKHGQQNVYINISITHKPPWLIRYFLIYGYKYYCLLKFNEDLVESNFLCLLMSF